MTTSLSAGLWLVGKKWVSCQTMEFLLMFKYMLGSSVFFKKSFSYLWNNICFSSKVWDGNTIKTMKGYEYCKKAETNNNNKVHWHWCQTNNENADYDYEKLPIIVFSVVEPGASWIRRELWIVASYQNMFSDVCDSSQSLTQRIKKFPHCVFWMYHRFPLWSQSIVFCDIFVLYHVTDFHPSQSVL